MAEAFIVRRGGGGSGGTLVVTSSGAGTVTVSNSTLGKSYSKTVTAGGSVTFKGLKTGTWTVTLSNGTQTATKTVAISADYSTSIAYFSATISITYPAKSTCTVKTSDGTTVASDSNTGSSTKTWTATVNATGTYTVTATATDGSGKSKSTTVSITAESQSESVTLAYELVLFSGGAVVPWSKYDQDSGNVTIGSTISFGTTHVYKGAYTTNKIDVTNYNTLYCVGTVTDIPYNDDRKPRICIANSPIKDTPSNYGVAHTLLTKGTKTFTLDISSFTGEYYVEVWGVAALSITDVYLQ